MNGELFRLVDAIEILLTNPISIFFIAIVTTVLNFEFLKKVPTKMKQEGIKEILIFGVLNGMFLVLVNPFIDTISPIYILVITPMILVIELAFVSEDTFMCYKNLYAKSVFNFGCMYWIITNILGFFSVKFLTYEIVFSITMIIAGIWSYYLTRSKRFHFGKYKMILHEKAAEKLFFRNIIICILFLVFFTWNFKIFSLSEILEPEIRRMLCGEMLLKIGFVWWSSRVLYEMVANQIEYVKNETYTENILDKERAFRNTIMRKGIFSLDLDITRDEFKEGIEWLNSDTWESGVAVKKVITGLLETCVHPEDYEEFAHTNDASVIRERVDSAPYYSHQIRVSPQGMLYNFSLGEALTKRYQETDKEWVWLKFDYIYTRDAMSGDIYAYVAVFDIDLQVEQGEILKQNATTDFLTGVLNRATMEKRIEEKLQQKLYAGTFFIIDVDNFKSVNDILGHPVGDQLLKQISSILTELFRKDDLVGRLGGDEFCVFMLDTVDPEAIASKAEKLVQSCRIECKGEQGESVQVSISVGIASCQKEISDYNKLYRCADLALYETKKMGKDSYTIYRKGM
ncbi:MAG: GGDEF domain-containing protein [Lachnospiraceae bacterium]|nr:GGDEF domain-containing protein [Lachnospiraceae bacterium]